MDKGAIWFYGRQDIQDNMLKAAANREVAIKYGMKGFGKRPDMLKYPRDIIEFAKNGATSFHMSEELWQDPLKIVTGMSKKDGDELRIGWDLVLDVDFEEWNSTKIIADALVKALRGHGIKSISCKFSGNKGFHIGVPFEAFPKKVAVKGDLLETKKLFPEGVQRIVKYLLYYIDNKENGFEISKKIMGSEEFKKFAEGKDDLVVTVCSNCETVLNSKKKESEFICPQCHRTSKGGEDERYMTCEKCKVFMQKVSESEGDLCSKCKGKDFSDKLDLKVDTMLISSRHLFRGVYSLHEKSGLASVPVDPDRILEFEKNEADPEKFVPKGIGFLDRKDVEGEEGKNLIIAAFDFKPEIEDEIVDEGKNFEFEGVKEAIPQEFFAPCILNILKGVQDGRKRSMFILVNYLASVGWGKEGIERILDEWNKKNEEPLSETIIKGHIRYHLQNKKKVLPPNCDNSAYYKDFRVCTPDNLCMRIKNPVTYSIRRSKNSKKTKKKAAKTILSSKKSNLYK